MSRRIEIELTSSREDGTWTWRAAGAREPKGVLAGSVLYEGAAVGEVCKAEAEFLLDGIEILETFAPKKKKSQRDDLLEMVSRPIPDSELVTEVRAPKGRGGGGRRDERGGRRNERGGDRSGGRDGERSGGDRGPRRERSERPRSDTPQRPKAKRLRPRRTHRDEVLASVPEEHRPIADQLLQGGLPAVRQAIEKQNAEAKAGGTPEVPVETIMSIAEPLAPKLRTAEWHDRADAALADLAELDLRDLRSVVGAADANARTDELRSVAEKLREGLSSRVEADHAAWSADLEAAVKEGRTVRALRLSSRPVKAGSPLPPEIAQQLATATGEALAADVAPDRWATVVDAMAYSPIRNAVTPAGYPSEPGEEFLEAIRRVADRVPAIAAHFNIDPSEAAKAKRRRPKRPAKGGGRDEKRGPRDDSRGPRDDSRGPRDDKRGGRRSGRDEGPKPKRQRDLPPVPGAQPKPEPEPEPEVTEEVSAEAQVDETTTESTATESTATESTATESTATESAATEAPSED